jgi:hypothetical protein
MVFQAVLMSTGSGGASVAVEPTILRVVRATPPVVTIPAGLESFPLVIDINAPEVFPAYRMEFRDTENREAAVVTSAAPESGTLLVLLPSADFPDGSYTMVLQGSGSESGTDEILEEYRFQVVREVETGQ